MSTSTLRIKRLASCLAVVGITFGGRLTAQSRPDFSGEWTTAGSSLTIKQDGPTLTVTEGSGTRTYNLDGSDTRFEQSSPNGTSQLTAQTKWVGSALVIATTTAGPSGTWQDLDVLSLDYGPKLSVVHVVTQTTSPMMGTTTKTYSKH